MSSDRIVVEGYTKEIKCVPNSAGLPRFWGVDFENKHYLISESDQERALAVKDTIPPRSRVGPQYLPVPDKIYELIKYDEENNISEVTVVQDRDLIIKAVRRKEHDDVVAITEALDNL